MWPYDQDSAPPAPLLDVLVHPPERCHATRSIRAKLDTGADVSARLTFVCLFPRFGVYFLPK